MSETIREHRIHPRWESLRNLRRDWRFILRGDVVLVGVEASLLDHEKVVNELTGQIDTDGLVEEAVHQYLELEDSE